MKGRAGLFARIFSAVVFSDFEIRNSDFGFAASPRWVFCAFSWLETNTSCRAVRFQNGEFACTYIGSLIMEPKWHSRHNCSADSQ